MRCFYSRRGSYGGNGRERQKEQGVRIQESGGAGVFGGGMLPNDLSIQQKRLMMIRPTEMLGLRTRRAVTLRSATAPT
jgi:hypothetical protein